MTLMYYERAPYLYTDKQGKAAGELVEVLREKLKISKIKFDFKNIPPKRQLKLIRKNTSSVCGIGWFENDQRKTFGKFSKAFYQDFPQVIVAHKSVEFKKEESLAHFFTRPDLIFLKKDGFSYGLKIDELEKNSNITPHVVTSSTESMVRMISLRKKYYTLLSKNEVEYLLNKLDVSLNQTIHFTNFMESTEGNTRHLFCSKQVPMEFLELIN